MMMFGTFGKFGFDPTLFVSSNKNAKTRFLFHAPTRHQSILCSLSTKCLDFCAKIVLQLLLPKNYSKNTIHLMKESLLQLSDTQRGM